MRAVEIAIGKVPSALDFRRASKTLQDAIPALHLPSAPSLTLRKEKHWKNLESFSQGHGIAPYGWVVGATIR